MRYTELCRNRRLVSQVCEMAGIINVQKISIAQKMLADNEKNRNFINLL